MIATLEKIFDYEKVEDAWKAILGGAAGDKATVYLEFCDDDRDASKAPYITVQMQSVVPTGEKYPYRPGEQIPHEWKANLISRVVTMRGVNSDKQREMVGRIRLAIHRHATLFTPARSPIHEVLLMRETQLARGVDEMNDWSEVHADIIFRVREDAWPK